LKQWRIVGAVNRDTDNIAVHRVRPSRSRLRSATPSDGERLVNIRRRRQAVAGLDRSQSPMHSASRAHPRLSHRSNKRCNASDTPPAARVPGRGKRHSSNASSVRLIVDHRRTSADQFFPTALGEGISSSSDSVNASGWAPPPQQQRSPRAEHARRARTGRSTRLQRSFALCNRNEMRYDRPAIHDTGIPASFRYAGAVEDGVVGVRPALLVEAARPDAMEELPVVSVGCNLFMSCSRMDAD